PGKGCHTGAEDGWRGDTPCGKCLVAANSDAVLRYPYDLHITGTLHDDGGQPLKGQFVKLYLNDGITEPTYPAELGPFRLRLGAPGERKGGKPLANDIGTRTDVPKGKNASYTLFMLPESYHACPPAVSPPPPRKPAAKKKH